MAECRTILNKEKSRGRRSMTRHLKIGYTLETISFARGSRVEREFGREMGADTGKEKEGRKRRKQREKKSLDSNQKRSE
jgi:hypothetical protein